MKKGFTLVEVLGVITVLSFLALLVYPIISDSLNDSKKKISEEQIKSLENITRIWATNNSDELNENTPRYVTIEELKRSGLVENDKILNTNNTEELKGCVKIYFENNKYNYKYDVYNDVNDCH